MENYCEAYHLPWIHPDLNTYSPLNVHYNIIEGLDMAGQGTLNYTPTRVSELTLPTFPEWPADKLKHAEYLALYPNVMLGLQADHTFSLILMPQGPDKTLERLQICYVGDAADDDAYRELRDAVMETWKVVFLEDVGAAEGMQRGRASPGFDGGVFTPLMDAPTHHFHSWVARKYQAAAR